MGMNTEETLRDAFCSFKRPSWRTHKLEEVGITYVMWHLLKRNFAVEIEGHKYDITFGLNAENEIGYTINYEGSPSMTSFRTIEKAFRIGKWFVISNEELSLDEKNSINETIKEREVKEGAKFLMERLGVSAEEAVAFMYEAKENEKDSV